MSQKYDIILWGATGFTGSLCVKYLASKYPPQKKNSPTWAIAGRTASKLQDVRDSVSQKLVVDLSDIEIITADIKHQESLENMTARAKVIISTAGPFALIGTPVVDACVATGTNYVDLTGEASWVREMINKHHDAAVSKKLKIITSSGFDCIPVDLGCRMIVEEMQKREIAPQEVRSNAVKVVGGGSGGTLASVFNMFDSLPYSELMALMNPFYLSTASPEDGRKLDQPSPSIRYAASDVFTPGYDSVIHKWVMPFVMQSIDTRVVNRSNALSNWKYGKNFIYSERMVVPWFVALLSLFVFPIGGFMLIFPITRHLLRMVIPAPGQGPSEKERDEGCFHFKMWGKGVDKNGNTVTVTGGLDAPDGDPGYKQTAVMIVEAAIALAADKKDANGVYGIVTPSTALGDVLVDRLAQCNIKYYIDK